ncbi:MAG: arylsulfatase, partial [Bacteroidales bacterium]|nr:arylsulfatase [Bacteroidales bacterium]
MSIIKGFSIGLLTVPMIIQAQDKPNIIYILADDLGYGDLSCLNKESKISTPFLDQLASEGMIFSDAHTASSVSTPSRYAILTGRYSWRSKLKNGVLHGNSTHLIPPDRHTVASILDEEGYNTACIGKWHLGMDWPTIDGGAAAKGLKNVDFEKDIQNGPLDLGFDYFFGLSGSLGMAPHVYVENRRAVEIPSRYISDNKILKKEMLNGRPGWMADGWNIYNVLPDITEKATSYIMENAGKGNPFFLYFPLSSPHKPVAPNEEFLGKSEAGAYGDFVVETDWVIGQILKAVKEAGVEKNTLIIFTADNGPENTMIQRKTEFDHFSSGEYRGCKRDNWEGGHRVPLLMKWPEKIKSGTISDIPVSLVDLMATVADINNTEYSENAGEDSHSILPLMLSENIPDYEERIIIHHSSFGHFAVRKGNWVLLLHSGSGGKDQLYTDLDAEYFETPVQLYNLAEDPGQFKNLYKEYPD